MGLFNFLASGGGSAISGALEGAGELAKDIRQVITGELSTEARAELERRSLEIEASLATAQAEINKAEAQHPSLWVSGARPAVLWVCVLALFYNFVLRPLLVGFGVAAMPEIDGGALWPMMGGLLGIGGMRTLEKIQGVNERHG